MSRLRLLRLLWAFALAAAALTLAPMPAHAMCIFLGPNALADSIAGKGELARDFDTVLVGTVTKVGPALETTVDDPTGGRGGVYTPVQVEVRRVLRGRGITKATFMNLGGTLPGSEGGMYVEDTFQFREGSTYVLVAHRNRDGTFSTSACTPSREINAIESARWLGQAVPDLPEVPAGGSRWPWIAGGLGAAFAAAGASVLRKRILAAR